jgi:hypothetical protein
MDIRQQFKAARNRSVPLVGIVSPDAAATISWIQKSVPNETPITLWDSARGLLSVNTQGAEKILAVTGIGNALELRNLTSDPVDAMDIVSKLPEQSIAIFLNLQAHWHAPEVAQAIWNLRDLFKSDFRTCVIIGPELKPPLVLHHDLVILDEPLPSDDEIVHIALSMYEAGGLPVPDETVLRRICETVRGLSAFAAEQAIALSMIGKGMNFRLLWHHKRKQIENTPGLKVHLGGETFQDLAGLDSAKHFISGLFRGPNPPRAIVYVEEIEKMFAGSASDFAGDGGVAKDALQTILTEMEENDWSGMILVGPPGSGKSLISRAVGATFDVPTIAFDLGATRQSLVGASEQNIRACFRVIQAVAQKGGAFWIATCNKHEVLPPELRRRFRYGIWYTGMPDEQELQAIWNLQRAKYQISEDDPIPTGIRYTGADVRNICEIAWRLQIPLKQAAQYIVPIALSDPQSIVRLEESADGRFLNASHPGVYRRSKVESVERPRRLAMEAK